MARKRQAACCTGSGWVLRARCWGPQPSPGSPALLLGPQLPASPCWLPQRADEGARCSLRKVPGSGSSYLSSWAPSAPALLLVCFVKHPRHWVARLPQVNPGGLQISQPVPRGLMLMVCSSSPSSLRHCQCGLMCWSTKRQNKDTDTRMSGFIKF